MTTELEQFQKDVARISAQQAEIMKRVCNGTFQAADVRLALQAIIERTDPLLLKQPSWYVSPRAQLECVRQLNGAWVWGFAEADFPSVPQDFVPTTPTEVLMLAVYLPDADGVGGVQRTFDELWAAMSAPAGFKKWRWPELKSDLKHLRLVEGKQHRPGLRWVAFDPFANWEPQSGRRVDSLWQSSEAGCLAASEVLMAAVLFPEWANSMDGQKVPHADLAGYQFRWEDRWSLCVCFDRWADDRQLKLRASWAADVVRSSSAPLVRDFRQ